MIERRVLFFLVLVVVAAGCCGGSSPSPTFNEGIEAGHFFPGLADDLLAGKTPEIQLGLTHLAARAWLGTPCKTEFIKDPQSLEVIDPESRTGSAGVPFAVDVYRLDGKKLQIVYGLVDLSAARAGDSVVIEVVQSPSTADRYTMQVVDVKPFAGHIRVHLTTPLDPPTGPLSAKPVRLYRSVAFPYAKQVNLRY